MFECNILTKRAGRAIQQSNIKTILFIEDESALQKILGQALSKENYEVIPALDGKTGLSLAKIRKPDAILLDLILPEIDGFEVLKRIKKDPKTKEIPVIVLTNLERREDEKRVLKMRAIAYLVKEDYDLEEVVKKIKEIIG